MKASTVDASTQRSRSETIAKKLNSSLSPTVLEVINESGQHNVPSGSETHFKVVVVSAAFEGLPRVRRHQLVYAALEAELRGGVHALAIVSKTPGEWESESSVPASPECLGGSKR